ncbi:MAG: PEP-CTERM sorting domain-containing protein [Phycisphaerae bacterium]|nr:PEP-CTERM sorting domain-containing protein [Phycisphaerae bacterium]
MKKLLAFVLVLSIASLVSASATPLYILTDGPIPDGGEVTVSAEAGLVGGEFTLSVDSGPGTFDLTNMVVSDEYVNVFVPNVYTGRAPWAFKWGVKAGTTATATSITLDGGNFAGGDTLLEELLLSGVVVNANGGQGNIVLNGITNGAPVEGLSVAYVPEPMTMSLLGLGGLALIRRRRA